MSKNFTLDQWLSYLESVHPSEIELGLGRIQAVADRLSLFPLANEVIVVAGTNGKGTTCAFIESYASQTNKSTGLYSSPHLISFNERVRLNSVEATDHQLVSAFEIIEKARAEISLTYYEFTTLAAFWLFKQAALDVVILEVGLGGRLDGVNIVDSDVALVTSISIDHESWLGSDIEVIGFEKAGVFRSGRPAVFGAENGPVSVSNHAKDIGASFYQAGKDYQLIENESDWGWFSDASASVDGLKYPGFPVQNIATALCALTCLNWPISAGSVNNAIQNISIRGRMERFEYNGVSGWLDVAHNPDSAAYLASQLKLHDSDATDLIAIFGCMSDKDIGGVVDELSDVIERWLCIDLPVERALPAYELSQLLIDKGLNAQSFKSFDDAFTFVSRENPESSSITANLVVLGSFFTVAEAITYYEQ